KYYFGDYDNIHGVRKLDGSVLALTKDKESLWLVLSFLKYSDPERTIQTYFDKNYKMSESKQFFDIEIYRYEKDNNSKI
ncbi:MAG: hypothetical protein QF568_00820, partial [Flavobacteriales bacterium]|nr:hypothetical protein [Flavobacteriales bacterium]